MMENGLYRAASEDQDIVVRRPDADHDILKIVVTGYGGDVLETNLQLAAAGCNARQDLNDAQAGGRIENRVGGMEDRYGDEVAERRAVQSDRGVGGDVPWRSCSGLHEREIVRQAAVGIETILDQEEGQPRTRIRRAKVRGPRRVSNVQCVGE